MDLVPIEWTPEQKQDALKGAAKEVVDRLFEDPNSPTSLKCVKIFLAMQFNPDLRRQVTSLIKFADKRRPLEGMPRKKKKSPIQSRMV